MRATPPPHLAAVVDLPVEPSAHDRARTLLAQAKVLGAECVQDLQADIAALVEKAKAVAEMEGIVPAGQRDVARVVAGDLDKHAQVLHSILCRGAN